MAYVVAQPCIGTKDRACVEVCPVQCFYENEDQLFIHPQECIDCDACMPVCPVSAIFPEAQVPEVWKFFVQKAIDYFAENPGVKPAKSKAEVGSGGVAAGSTHWAWKGSPALAGAALPTTAAPNPVAESTVATPPPPASADTLRDASASPASPPPPGPAPAPESERPPRPALPSASTEVTPPPTPQKSAQVPPAPPKSAPPAATKVATPKPMDPDEYRRIRGLLDQVLEMVGGSRPVDFRVFAEAEATGKRLKKEVAAEFGRDNFTSAELEKKGVTLRQKYDVAQALLQAVERAQFIPRYKAKRRRVLQAACGGAATALISALCGALALRTVQIDALMLEPNPGLGDLLRALLNPESLVPVLAFQMIAAVFGLFTLWAFYQSWQASRELHELKRAMQAKHVDPEMIARLA